MTEKKRNPNCKCGTCKCGLNTNPIKRMTTMFTSINRLHVKLGMGQQLEARFAVGQGLEQTPGFVSFRLLKRTWHPHGDPNLEQEEYLAVTVWESESDFKSWVASPAFKAAHSGPKLDIFAAPGEPAGYEVAVERLPALKGG